MLAIYHNKKGLQGGLYLKVFNKNPVKLMKYSEFMCSYTESGELAEIFLLNSPISQTGFIRPSKFNLQLIEGITKQDLSSFYDSHTFKVVKINKIEPVKNTHLNYCEIFDGVNSFNLICGDQTISPGIITVWAKPQSILPDGSEIKESKIMNLNSLGMLCSKKELGLEEESKGIIRLKSDFKLGSDFNELYVA